MKSWTVGNRVALVLLGGFMNLIVVGVFHAIPAAFGDESSRQQAIQIGWFAPTLVAALVAVAVPARIWVLLAFRLFVLIAVLASLAVAANNAVPGGLGLRFL